MNLSNVTTEMINSYSAANGKKYLDTLKEQSTHAMRENEALLMSCRRTLVTLVVS